MKPASATRRSLIAGAAASAAVLASSASATSAKTHDVAIKEFKFDPEHLRVHVGDTIRWTNHDLAPHTATADEFGWDTEELARGQAGELIVTKETETSYFCVFHPHMKGSFDIS